MLKELCNDFVDKNLKKSEKEITEIEKQTVDQSGNELWKKERQIRLTSSNFGIVMARRSTNVSTSIVQRIIYSKFKGNIHTIRGLTQEKNTVIEYENMHSNVIVKKKQDFIYAEPIHFWEFQQIVEYNFRLTMKKV